LGFPKMGTSSIHAFFGCAGYRSMHFRCHPSYACAECLQKQYHNLKRDRRQGVVVENKVDLKSCGISDVYSQIDRDNYFPQVRDMKLERVDFFLGHLFVGDKTYLFALF
jgi:hypothetical protein